VESQEKQVGCPEGERWRGAKGLNRLVGPTDTTGNLLEKVNSGKLKPGDGASPKTKTHIQRKFEVKGARTKEKNSGGRRKN